MIRKQLDPFSGNDKYAIAGRRAEERMAFYLKRFFGHDPNIHVVNGLRLARDGDTAQMDHLVIHAHGLVIVESKGVAGKIEIKDDGQWLRWYDGESRGIASPVTQARLQAGFLRNELSRATGKPDLIQTMPIQLLVAISDDGEIIWPSTGPIPEVCKADQVADRIHAIMQPLAATNTLPWFRGANQDKLVEFLIKCHKPSPASRPKSHGGTGGANPAPKPEQKAASATQSVPRAAPSMLETKAAPDNPAPIKPPQPPGSSPGQGVKRICFHCQSDNVEIRFGHNYYFHCLNCDKNFGIKNVCKKCGQTMTMRKQGREFFRECASCGASTLYYVNPEKPSTPAKNRRSS